MIIYEDVIYLEKMWILTVLIETHMYFLQELF